MVIALCECVMKVLRRRQPGWSGSARRGRGSGDWCRHKTLYWPKPHGFDGRL